MGLELELSAGDQAFRTKKSKTLPKTTRIGPNLEPRVQLVQIL
jgi:hypothetical protein